MEDDPKDVAAEIVGEMKAEKSGAKKAQDPDGEGDDGENVAADALKDMFSSMQSGDFAAAASALKAAMAASED